MGLKSLKRSLERVHMNQFVHPLLDTTLWIIASVNYVLQVDCGGKKLMKITSG
jgi:hypothetical protein